MRYSEREYKDFNSCSFRKTKEIFGGLSNMASGFPLMVNGLKILTSEALYQACRYPHLPEVQEVIIAQKSPMTAKMKSKSYYAKSRSDWDNVRIKVMRWCLRVKLAQNFQKFGLLLESTGTNPIVEDSKRDSFWGAKKFHDGTFRGVNALGRLLMELRQEYCSMNRYKLLYVTPLKIDNFNLLGEPIQIIDERFNFIELFVKNWNANEAGFLELFSQLSGFIAQHNTGAQLDKYTRPPLFFL